MGAPSGSSSPIISRPRREQPNRRNTMPTSTKSKTSKPKLRLVMALFWVLALLSCSFSVAAAEAELPEYKLKAGFLYNFAKFVTWPEKAFPSAHTPLVIGVLGNDPFGPVLPKTLAGKTVNGRPLEIQYFKRLEEIKNCQILFISPSEKERYSAVLAAL